MDNQLPRLGYRGRSGVESYSYSGRRPVLLLVLESVPVRDPDAVATLTIDRNCLLAATAKSSPYQIEHDRLFEAIREDKPYNETERCAYAALTGILGRMAAESGERVTWEQAMNSQLELAPGLEDYTMESEAPVKPEPDGSYPVAMPGTGKLRAL